MLNELESLTLKIKGVKDSYNAMYESITLRIENLDNWLSNLERQVIALQSKNNTAPQEESLLEESLWKDWSAR